MNRITSYALCAMMCCNIYASAPHEEPYADGYREQVFDEEQKMSIEVNTAVRCFFSSLFGLAGSALTYDVLCHTFPQYMDAYMHVVSSGEYDSNGAVIEASQEPWSHIILGSLLLQAVPISFGASYAFSYMGLRKICQYFEIGEYARPYSQ